MVALADLSIGVDPDQSVLHLLGVVFERFVDPDTDGKGVLARFGLKTLYE